MTKYKWPLMKNTITWQDRMNLIWFIATTRQFTNGPKVRKFESQWNQWLGSKYSIYVSSGSTANTLLMSAVKELYGLKNGDKVLVPACTWVTNVGPVIQCGLRPIFCDINLRNYSFDIDHMKKIAVKHKNIKAVFVTHLLGYSAEVEKYKDIFPDALILEDICESHGVRDYIGRRRGAESLGATFSFYFGHHMTTVEGGMVSTCNEELYNLMRIKRSHGLARELPKDRFAKAIADFSDVDPKFMFLTDGYNFRNTEIGAVLGSSQLKRLDDAIEKRQENHNKFLELMTPFVDTYHLPASSPMNSNYAFPIIPKDHDSSVHLKKDLEYARIETRPIVSGNLLLQPFLKDYKLEPGSKNNIDILHKNGVYVGNNHLIGQREIDRLADVIYGIKW